MKGCFFVLHTTKVTTVDDGMLARARVGRRKRRRGQGGEEEASFKLGFSWDFWVDWVIP